ncbi:DUF7563 family protein [Halorussus rarus]
MAVQLPDSDSDRSTRDYCGAHVTADFRRTYGTEDRRAKRCPACDSWVRLQARSACGKNVDHLTPSTTTTDTAASNSVGSA